MGKITVIRVEKSYPKYRDIYEVMRYACSEKGKKRNTRLLYWGTCGLPKDLKKAVAGLIHMQEYLDKAKGRRINHIIVSFPESVQDEKLVFIVADRLAKYLGTEYPLIYGVHQDTANLHIHFAMNTVSYRTGLKFHKSIKEFNDWTTDLIRYTEDLLAEWGVYV